MTVTKTRRRSAPMLDLDPARQRRGELSPGLCGITSAMSADGLWILQGAAARWTGEYLPTGDQVIGKTLAAVRRQAAAAGVLDRFRARAAAVVADLGPLVDAGALDELAALGAFEAPATTYRLARRRLDVLDGRMVAAYEFDGICACGGYLAGDVHGDGCTECLTLSPGLRIRCRQLDQHQACAAPDPVLCDHGCRQRAGVAPCWRGRDFCCGCCDPR